MIRRYLNHLLPTLPPSWLKFIHGQQLFWSLRITLGCALPAIWLMVPMQLPVQGMAAGVGAVCVGILDVPGSLRTKHREMLICALMVILSGCLTALSLHFSPWMWLSVVLISACGAYAMNFGLKAAMIGLNCVVVMAMAQSLNGMPTSMVRAYLGGLALGSVWYVYFSLLVCALLRHQMHRRALADCLFATASHFRARAACYDPAAQLGQARIQLLNSQNRLQLAQMQARDLVLGELSQQPVETLSAQQLQLFNLFADSIDLYDLVVAAHTDFAGLQRHPCPDLQLRFKALLEHGAMLLERIASAVSLGQRVPRLGLKTVRLHEIEAAMARCAAGSPPPAVRATLEDSVQRMRDMLRLIAKTVRDTRSQHNTSGLDLPQVLQHYHAPTRLFFKPQAWLSGPAPAYALRLALAMVLALLAAQLTGGTHGSWVVLTVAVALRPGFGLSRQRGLKRVQGTLAGCAAALGLLALIQEPHLLLFLTLLSLLLSLGLASIEYMASVFFTSVMVVLLYHLILPSDTHVADLRLLDTVIGAAIALLMTYVAPYWEFHRIRPQCSALRETTRRYLESLLQLQPATVIHYRATRRDLLSSLAALSATCDSMLLDPESKQHAAAQVQSLLLWGHVLLSLGNTLALRLPQTQDIEAHADVALALQRLNAPAELCDCPPPENNCSVQIEQCAQNMQQLITLIEQRVLSTC
jgi:uncharacterized membrane protein YccC